MNRELATIQLHMPDITALLSAPFVVSFSRSELRWELAKIAAAVTILSIALAAIVFFFFRRRTRDLTLIYFALFCSLYAVRLLNLAAFRSLFDKSRMFWDYVDWVITCTILLPCTLFFYQVGGEHLRKFLRWLLAVQTVFAIFGILAAALGVSLAKLGVANNIVVLGTSVATALFLIASKRRSDTPRGLTLKFVSLSGVFSFGFCSSCMQISWVLKFCLDTTWSFLVSLFSSGVSDTSPRTAHSRTKNDSSPSTKSWKSPAGFSPPRFRKASPPSRDSKLQRATCL